MKKFFARIAVTVKSAAIFVYEGSNMKKYKKLVRDNIPQIIKNSGKEPVYRVLDDAEYWLYLLLKDNEELTEVKNAATVGDRLKELADKLEIIRAMAEFHGFTLQDVIKKANGKRNEKGGFNNRYFLEKVVEK